MAMKINAKFERKLASVFKNDLRNLLNFHRMKNLDFILESKMVELNEIRNSKKTDRPDAQ